MKIYSIIVDDCVEVPVEQVCSSLWVAESGPDYEFQIKRISSRERRGLRYCKRFWCLVNKQPALLRIALKIIESRCGTGRRVGAVWLVSELRNYTSFDSRKDTGFKVHSGFGSLALRVFLAENPEKRLLLGIKGKYNLCGLPEAVRCFEDFIFDQRLIDVVPERHKNSCTYKLNYGPRLEVGGEFEEGGSE